MKNLLVLSSLLLLTSCEQGTEPLVIKHEIRELKVSIIILEQRLSIQEALFRQAQNLIPDKESMRRIEEASTKAQQALRDLK